MAMGSKIAAAAASMIQREEPKSKSAAAPTRGIIARERTDALAACERFMTESGRARSLLVPDHSSRFSLVWNIHRSTAERNAGGGCAEQSSEVGSGIRLSRTSARAKERRGLQQRVPYGPGRPCGRYRY